MTSIDPALTIGFILTLLGIVIALVSFGTLIALFISADLANVETEPDFNNK